MSISGFLGHMAVILILAVQQRSATSGHPDQSLCRPEFCAFVNISCPDDSKPIDNTYNISHQMTNDDYVEEFPNISSKFKRSVRQYKRRESIKIVPVGYIHKRSVPDSEDFDLNQTEDMNFLQKCCEKHRCVCDTLCYQPKCAVDQVLIVEREATNLPGNCCPAYKCHPIRSTQQQETTCFSSLKKRHYFIGDIWMDDDCTQCHCDNYGQKNCQSSSCKPIHCEKKILNRGECCPVCDLSNSKYCTGQEDCDIVCRHGYDIDVTGCTICRCAKHPITTYPIDDRGTDVQTAPTDVSINNIDMSIFEDFLYNYLIYIVLLIIILVIGIFSFWKYFQNKKNNRSYNTVPSV